MILIHDPAGLLVDHLLLEPVSGLGIDLMKMRFLRLG